MITVGLELTSFIDPSLTWKTLSKGRSTSRRSRNMNLDQEQEKRITKQSSLQSSEDAEKSSSMVHERRVTSNMKHIPIKKRRFSFKSPSSPLQSSNCHGEFVERGSQCTSDRHTSSNVSIESQATDSNVSSGSKSKHINFDGYNDESSVKSSDELHGTGDDSSGIAILAAAACSDRLDNSSDDTVMSPSQIGGLFEKQHQSCDAAYDVKATVTDIHSLDLLGKNTDGCAVNLSNDKGHTSVSNEADDVEMSPMTESQTLEQDKSVAGTSGNNGSVGIPFLDSLNNDDEHVNKESISDMQNEVAHKTSEDSGRSRRFLWDLNVVMDEWDDVIDDTSEISSAQAMEVIPMDSSVPQNLEESDGSKAKEIDIHNLDVEGCLGAARSEATQSCGKITSQVEVCVEPECVGNAADFSSVSPTIKSMELGSQMLSGFVASILKESSSPSNVNIHVVETPMLVTGSEIQNVGASGDANVDPSLSLRLNGIKSFSSQENSIKVVSENPNQVAEENLRSMHIVQFEEHESGSLLPSIPGNACSEVKVADNDFKVEIDNNDNEVGNVNFQAAAQNSPDGNQIEIAALKASELGNISCKDDALNRKVSEQPEQVISLLDIDAKHGEVVDHSSEYRSSCSENDMSELKDSCVPLCSSNFGEIFITSVNMSKDQALNRVTERQIEDKPIVSADDPVIPNGSNCPEPKILDPFAAADESREPTDEPFAERQLGCSHGSHVYNEESVQATENVAHVGMEGDYDSHLEDGELREPRFWEDNEREEVETEHVDYDSDNRDGIVFYEAANDSTQLPGETSIAERERQIYRSDNFSSADEKQNPDKGNEEQHSFRVQGCLSTVNSLEPTVCTTQKSPSLKVCSEAVSSDKVELVHKDCRSSIEADSLGKDFETDSQRTERGAFASVSDLHLSNRCSEAKSRSSSLAPNPDGQDETTTKQLSTRVVRLGGRSWNPESKSMVGNGAAEDDSERIIRASDDTSPFRNHKPRIINTSRSSYQFVRRGSPGDREGDYGLGIMKLRDFSPDSNPRNRFGRFGMNRGGIREGYRRPNVYDPPKSGGGGPMMNRFGKRERSFSPVGDRFHKCRSRSRSPDFRSEARMGRGRMLYQQSSRERRSPQLRMFNQNQRFDTTGSPGRLRSDDCVRPSIRPMRFHGPTTSGRAIDFDEGDGFRRKPLLMRNPRRSRSRSRSCSPEFRCDAQIRPMRVRYQPSTDHIRERSPVRGFRTYQRCEGGGSPVRLRTEERSRPMMRPRFPDSSHPERGHEFNKNNNNNINTNNGEEYRRKPRNIFERIHPIRHYDMEGDARRFPYDEENGGTQNFRRGDNYVRGPGERRPVEFRGPGEERGNVRYNNNSERVFYSGPKQQFGGGMRDYGDEEGIPRRVRP